MPEYQELLLNKKLLIVEDNLLNLEVLTELFVNCSADVVAAESGEMGVEMAMEELPDLILMDIHLPDIDGIEATRRLRQQPQCQQIPIIGLTADAFTERRDAALAAGMNGYITKPVSFSDLLEQITTFLN